MRVAHVNDIAFVGSTLVQTLRSCGVEAELLDTRKPGAGWAYPWKIATFLPRLAVLLPAIRDLRAGRYDIVHIHYARLGMIGLLSGRPYVIHCHGTDVRGMRPRSLWGLWMRTFLRGAAGVYYATPDLAQWVKPLRSDAAFLPNPIPMPEQLATGDGVASRRDVLVGVRLDSSKGIQRIEEILAALACRRPQTSVTIIAQGSGIKRIRAAAGDNVRIIPIVAHAEMPGLFAAHRIAIGQMRAGAIGNYELEALAAGVPVAAAFRFPEAYPVRPPLLDVVDVAAAATAIASLLDDEPTREASGSAGRAWVGTYHDPATIAARLIADYAAALGAP